MATALGFLFLSSEPAVMDGAQFARGQELSQFSVRCIVRVVEKNLLGVTAKHQSGAYGNLTYVACLSTGHFYLSR